VLRALADTSRSGAARAVAAGQPARARQPPVAVRALPARPVAGQGRPAQAAGLL